MICTLNFGHKHARKVLCVHSNLAVYTRSREVCCIHSKRTINSQSRDWWANLFKHPTSKVLKLHSLEINSQPRKVLYNVLRFSQKHKGYQACSRQTLSSCLSQYYSFFIWHSQQYSTICIMALQMGREIADFLMLSAGFSSSESLKNQPDSISCNMTNLISL